MSNDSFRPCRSYDAKRQKAAAIAAQEELRNRGMGERRKRYKDDLERRERELAQPATVVVTPQATAAAKVAQLAREGRAQREAAAQAAERKNAAAEGIRVGVKRARDEAAAQLQECQVRCLYVQ
jgi:hypothetical protein